MSLDLEAEVGLESQGGVVRADSAGVRVWSRHDPGRGAQTGSAPTGGAGSDQERDPCAAEEDGARIRIFFLVHGVESYAQLVAWKILISNSDGIPETPIPILG